MKIIALLPFKNEAWVIPSYLSSMTKIADEIIALDDDSIDEGPTLLQAAGAKVIKLNTQTQDIVNMSSKRQFLLEEGRKAGGTHFIWLDADEVFSENFVEIARQEIQKLKMGQKITLRWVHSWQSKDRYLDDKSSPYGNVWKDFIVCDKIEYKFEDKLLSEGRTQGPYGDPYVLNQDSGVVIHFQFLNGRAMHFKHTWYKCQELMAGKRSARRINATYKLNYDQEKKLETKKCPDHWVKNIVLPSKENPHVWHEQKIYEYFDKYGITFFEGLDIWAIPELKNKFVEQTGRNPKPDRFPNWLIFINNYKNILINKIRVFYNMIKFTF